MRLDLIGMSCGLVLAGIACEKNATPAPKVNGLDRRNAEITREHLPATGATAVTAGIWDRRALEVIREYVRRTRSWDQGQYRIEDKGQKEGLTVYWVVNVDDERSPAPGGGRSFAVDYDPFRQQVVRESGFQ